MSSSHFAAFFFGVQLIGGLLLLSGYFVPLALTLLAAELYNILAFHLHACASEHRSSIGSIQCLAWLVFSNIAKVSRTFEAATTSNAGIICFVLDKSQSLRILDLPGNGRSSKRDGRLDCMKKIGFLSFGHSDTFAAVGNALRG